MASKSSRPKPPTTKPNLRDEIISLKAENEKLKQILDRHGLLVPLNTEGHNHKSDVNEKTPSPPKTSAISDSAAELTPRRKGCSCQGKCATRVCGCVKKQVSCGEFCRCADDQCQNQEPDKENIGERENQAELSEAGQENLRKLASLSLKDRTESKEGKSGRSNKRVETVIKKPGLFSPVSSGTSPNFNIHELESEPLTFERDLDREISERNDDEVFESHNTANNGNKSKTARKVAGRSRRQNLAPVRPKERSRSALSREQEDEPSAHAEREHNRRTTSLGESGAGKASKEKKNKTSAAGSNGTKPLRRGVAAKLGEASLENIEDPEGNNEKVEEMNKKAKKPAKGKSKKKGNSNAKPTDEQQAEVDELLEVVASNIQLVAAQQTMQVEPQKEEATVHPAKVAKAEPETHSNENIVVASVKRERPEIDFIPFRDDSPHHVQSPSNSSSGSSPGFDQLSIDDPNFNPMKPRHNLTRSPLGLHTHSRTFLDVSERPLVPPMEEAAEELPPPEELNNVIVDWDKHQQERVYCSKCKRGFYPYRIKKHEASCKKV